MPALGRILRRRRREDQRYHPHTINVHQDIRPHLEKTVYITGAFAAAWAWDLVYYGGSHAAVGENPLHHQLGFGSSSRAPQHVAVLVLQYLAVCAGAAILANFVAAWPRASRWSQAAVAAIEFFPSPVFAGKLMGYLTQTFPNMDAVHSAFLNLVATWFAGALAHAMPMLLAHLDAQRAGMSEQWQLQRFATIVQNTLGFGLGIAWNVLLGNLLGPEGQDEDLSLFRLIGLSGYLAVVTLLSFRLAAAAATATASTSTATIVDRQWILIEFASYVVNAFTLVAFLNALLNPSWIGHLVGLCILWILSAVMSAFVARADLEETSTTETAIPTAADDSTVSECQPREGYCTVLFCLLLFVPCTWFCCPWVPVLWLLAGSTDESSCVKERWYKLIAMVAGLAASIEASGTLTEATNEFAASFCTVKQCNRPWLFVTFQTVVAVVVTLVLIPSISQLAISTDASTSNEATSFPNSTNASTEATFSTDLEDEMGERMSLLKKVRDHLRIGGKSLQV